MNEISHTQYFKTQKVPEVQVKDIIADVYTALTEKRVQSGQSDCRLYHVR